MRAVTTRVYLPVYDVRLRSKVVDCRCVSALTVFSTWSRLKFRNWIAYPQVVYVYKGKLYRGARWHFQQSLKSITDKAMPRLVVGPV